MRAMLVAAVAFLGPASFAAGGGAVHAPAVPTSIAPTKVAWYDASRPSAITPAAPMPGVGPKDLLVEGLTINTALLPISLPIPTLKAVTAYTALQFHLPAGASAASLTLKLTGLTTAPIDAKLPSGVTPIACPATSTFHSGAQQPTSAAPKYDCSKRSTVGQLGGGGKSVTFPGISRLQTGNTLSVVILPGSLGLERLVFSAPDKTTLSLLDFSSPGEGTTPPPVPTPSPTCCAGPSSAHGPGSGVPAASLPPAVTVPSPVVSQPEIAPSGSTPATTPVALSTPDDHRERIRAIGMLVALVVVTSWLTLTDRRRQPLSQDMGVGRFRSARSGPPPTI